MPTGFEGPFGSGLFSRLRGELDAAMMAVAKENGEFYDPDVPRDKLRAGTRLQAAKMKIDVAGLMNPDYYGKRVQQTTTVLTASVDALLVNRARKALDGVFSVVPDATERQQDNPDKAPVWI